MDLFTFLLAVLLLELTPGPNMAYLATLALSRGRAAGLIATAGVAFGLAVHAVTAVHGSIVILAAQLRPWLVKGPRKTVRRVVARSRLARLDDAAVTGAPSDHAFEHNGAKSAQLSGSRRGHTQAFPAAIRTHRFRSIQCCQARKIPVEPQQPH